MLSGNVLRAADMSPGSTLIHFHEGLRPSVRDLLYLMITLSDNTATDMLWRLVGLGSVGSDLGARLWLRSERQTLRRLPRSRDVLFTIRIRQCRLADLCRVAGTAARLLAQIDSMPDALKGYKRILEIEVPLREWLRRQARG